MNLKELKKNANQQNVELQIGKNGLTPTMLDEIGRRLQQHPLVKIRLLKSCDLDTEDVAKQAIEKFQTTVIESKGYTITFLGKSKNKQH